MKTGLASIIGVYVLLALLYSLHTPPFEAPDEYFHFAVIRHLARTGELPPGELLPPLTYSENQTHPWRQAAFHAPLYYAIAAALIAPVDTSNFLTAYRLNPHARIGIALADDNQNFIAHVGSEWTGTGLARLVSIADNAALPPYPECYGGMVAV